jgi:rod shape-determining protein MreB and related proteins
VYVNGRGVVLNEPSVVAISTVSGRVKAVGRAAHDMIGRTPETIEVVRPMQNGVIADYVVTEAMLKHFIGRAAGRFNIMKPTVMICIPAGVTSVERRAVKDAAMQAGAQEVYLIREPLAAAIGARVPVSDPNGSLIIDIGGGTAEVAVIALNGIVESNSIRVGGNKLDEYISNFIKRKYNLLIGDRTAEELKIKIGSALPCEEEMSMDVRGRDQVAGMPRTITVHTNEIVESLAEPLEAIVGAVRTVLERTPPELASDIIDRGMIMTGGGALLRHIDELMTQITGIPCYVADQPLQCVAIGTGIALEKLDLLRDSLLDE